MMPNFRVWDKQLKILRPAVFIDFVAEEAAYWFDEDTESYCPFKECILMQSTGLFDKNGKEIYEGDVVKAVSFAKWIGVVKYLPEKAAFVLDEIEPSEYREPFIFLSQFQDGFEVLGNIYENPELLEKS